VSRKTAAALAAIVLIGAALRFAGIGFGLPLRLRPDETTILDGVRDLAARDGWHPRFFAYPGLALYAPLGVLRLVHAAEPAWRSGPPRAFAELLDDRWTPLLALRSFSAVLGTLTIVVAFAIGRRLAGEGAALAAAAFLAAAFLHARDSHFATTDVPAAFWASLAVLAMIDAAETGRMRSFAACGAAIGAAAAWKYLPAVLLAPAAAAALIAV
jgi:4-amino-4-deoxy-L-arabinose transferase-like glycosyltransferase